LPVPWIMRIMRIMYQPRDQGSMIDMILIIFRPEKFSPSSRVSVGHFSRSE